MNNPRPSMHFTELDGIKGIISFFIIFIHYKNRTVSGDFPAKFLPSLFVDNGWMFVELFFIISGFLFSRSQKIHGTGTSFGAFMANKIKKLYLPAAFATLFDVIVRLMDTFRTGKDFGLSIKRVIETLTFSDTLVFNEQPFPSVLWYLHVLFLCYVLFFLGIVHKLLSRLR